MEHILRSLLNMKLSPARKTILGRLGMKRGCLTPAKLQAGRLKSANGIDKFFGGVAKQTKTSSKAASSAAKPKKKGLFSKIWSGIKKAVKGIGKAFKAVGKAILNPVKTVVGVAKGIGKAIFNPVKTVVGAAKSIGKAIFSPVKTVVGAAKSIGKAAINTGKKLFANLVSKAGFFFPRRL